MRDLSPCLFAQSGSTITNQNIYNMEAKATLKIKRSEKCGEIKWYEIKIDSKEVCKLYYPNIFHPDKWKAEFGTFALLYLHYEKAFQDVAEKLKAMYGVTKITESKLGYPWELLEIFEDPLLADVKP